MERWQGARTALWIALAALLPRLLLLAILWQHPERALAPDSSSYQMLAEALRAGRWLESNAPASGLRTPAYPLFLAFLSWLFGPGLRPVLVAQALLGALGAAFVYLLGRRLLPEPAARLGGLLYAVSLGPIVYGGFVLTETLFSLLLLGVIWALGRCREEPSPRRAAAAGALLGLAALCRPIALLFPLAAVPLLWLASPPGGRRRLGHAALFAGATLLALSPWVLRNQHVLGRPVVSTVGETNLLLYNAVALAADRSGENPDRLRVEVAAEFRREVERLGIARDETRQARLLRSRAWAILQQAPGRYLYLHLKSDLNSLLPSFPGLTRLLGLEEGERGTLAILQQEGLGPALRHYFRDRLAQLWLILPFALLLGATYAGALAGAWDLARRRRWWLLALLSLPTAYLLLLPGPPSVPRFRVPAMPYLCLLAGHGWLVFAALRGQLPRAGIRHPSPRDGKG